MKKIIYLFVLINIFGCSDTYIEYNIKNSSSNSIFVEIKPKSSIYKDSLSFKILPNQKLNVFEAKVNINDSLLSNPFNPFKSFRIRQNLYKFSLIDSCDNYSISRKEQSGLLGNYVIIEFAVNDSSFTPSTSVFER